MLNFKPAFSLSSLTLIKRLFSSSSLSVIRVVSSAYLKWLIFPMAILILACVSSNLAFYKMYSACMWNKQGDNIQHCHILFTIFKQSIVPCLVLTAASWLSYRFLRCRYSHLFKNFLCLLWSTQSKAFTQSTKQTQMFFWNSLTFSMS